MGLYYIDERIPSIVYVKYGESQYFDLEVPAKAEVVEVVSRDGSNIPEGELILDLRDKVSVPAEGIYTYTLKVRLFGMLPFKEMTIRVVEEEELIPVGIPVGIYMETRGVMVIGVGEFRDDEGNSVSPARTVLYSGDYIYKVNGEKMQSKKEFTECIRDSDGQTLNLEILRNGQIVNCRVTPRKDETGNYKLGIWVRDNTQGVGTMTYIDGKGNFGALGHGINDIDTNSLMDITEGTIYETRIVDIKKGEQGDPGEMTGMIVYSDEHMLGNITDNNIKGIFGSLNDRGIELLSQEEALPVGLKQEIQKGAAQILCTMDGETALYDIDITAVHLDHDNVNRGIELKVTDERLIQSTGGIIQGMSGSPIIQNGKIVGAVTHVLVNDPKKGYGIFIEEMLNHEK